MKPLDDKELSKLLQERFNETNKFSTSTKWTSINEKIITKSGSNVLTYGISTFVVISIFLYSGLFLLENGVAGEAQSEFLAIEEVSQDVINSSPQTELTSAIPSKPENLETKSYDINDKITSDSLLIAETTDASLSTETFENKAEKNEIENKIEDLKSSDAGDISDIKTKTNIIDKTGNKVIEDQFNGQQLENRKKSFTFSNSDLSGIKIEPFSVEIDSQKITPKSRKHYWVAGVRNYQSFHTLTPEKLDEYIIREPDEQELNLISHMGVGIDFGLHYSIGKKTNFIITTSLDQYFTSLDFRIINWADPNVNLKGSNLELGLNFGASHRIKIFKRTSILGGHLVNRVALYQGNFQQKFPYPKFYSRYEVFYKFEPAVFSNMMLGIYYQSLFRQLAYNSIGIIKPNVVGVTVEKKFGK